MGKDDFLEKRDYKEWMPIKADTHNAGRYRTFSEGQIWWCIWGENVGTEIDGKGELFLRPVYKSLALWRKSLKMEIEVNQYLLKDHNGVG